ncbi:hypothetical protein [Myxococcus qinghaiensis]|uniref:hypothetical protein n=1 Tax=Myxococcus qinghaiensis TaxID=2906758 RepID=UPI0020A82BD4|nr:hypothetical protein [Myxococcus qinghaiensis]
MMCLFASRLWNIPWDQLESIPAPGKRFDYRGSNNSIRGIFEAKGTKYSRNQGAHIKHGVEKKAEHHKRGERYDVELIVSTCVAAKEGRSRIMVADPEFDFGELAFGPDSSYFFRLRHYARVLHYAGLTPLARNIYEEAVEMLRPSLRLYNRLQISPATRFSSRQNIQLSQVRAGKRDYLGKWIDYQIPPDDPESSFSIKPRKAAKLLSVFPKKLQLFQGIDLDIFESIQSGRISKLTVDSAPSTPSHEVIAPGEEIAPGIQASIFPDGSIMAASVSGAGNSKSPDITAWHSRKEARNRIR